jgi:peptide-methionine (S)-S-oxide reductase
VKRALLVLAVLAALAAAFFGLAGGNAPEAAPPPRAAKVAAAVFAGGCFWCTEADFDKVRGVVSTTSGYAGGRIADPSYEQVSAGGTGHYEAVRVVYDPTKVSFAQLVSHFFKTIDPLDGGGQFCDRGDQYRSAIFVANESERRIAEGTKGRAAKRLGKPIATQVVPAARFWPAETYHQDYYTRNPVRYRFYRFNCGRDGRLRKVWGDAGK